MERAIEVQSGAPMIQTRVKFSVTCHCREQFERWIEERLSEAEERAKQRARSIVVKSVDRTIERARNRVWRTFQPPLLAMPIHLSGFELSDVCLAVADHIREHHPEKSDCSCVRTDDDMREWLNSLGYSLEQRLVSCHKKRS